MIAVRLDVPVRVVTRWRKRFHEQGLDGLKDRPRTAAGFSPLVVVTVKALACELPAESGVPLSRWSAPELVVEAIARGDQPPTSATARRLGASPLAEIET